MSAIEIGNMVFFTEGKEGIGAVREVRGDGFTLYVENAGEFFVPQSAVVRVHDGKVLVDRAKVDVKLREALKHTHDSEDPKLLG